MVTAIFDAIGEPIADRVTSGLSKIGMVLRTQAWKVAKPEGLTPLQAQALETLKGRSMGLKSLAVLLGVAGPTATVAVNTLVDKGLVHKEPGEDRRSVSLSLTAEGRQAAERLSAWPEVLTHAVDSLDADEQESALKLLVKLVASLQREGHIANQRMCVSCEFFRPRVHDDPLLPHHCAFVDAAFGDRHLRLDCPEQLEAGEEQQERAWSRFTLKEDGTAS